MIVFNLSCEHQHSFEGWFRSANDFETQQERGLVSCPVCGSAKVTRGLSAPRLNVSASRLSRSNQVLAIPSPGHEASQTAPRASGSTTSGSPAMPSSSDTSTPNPTQLPGPTIEQMQALWYKMARQVIESTEDVGKGFAEEARKIHYKEAPERAIRGQASAQERAELAEEGIDVYALPLPASVKEPLQ
jgi:hypothetical protein